MVDQRCQRASCGAQVAFVLAGNGVMVVAAAAVLMLGMVVMSGFAGIVMG